MVNRPFDTSVFLPTVIPSLHSRFSNFDVRRWELFLHSQEALVGFKSHTSLEMRGPFLAALKLSAGILSAGEERVLTPFQKRNSRVIDS